MSAYQPARMKPSHVVAGVKKEAQAADRRIASGCASILVGAGLLEAMAQANGPLHLRELAVLAKVAPQKAHRYLLSLIAAGLAEQDAASGRYDLGGMSLRLGLAALNRKSVIRHTTEVALEFGRSQDVTVAVGVWGDHGPTVVAWQDAGLFQVCNFGIGSVVQLLRSASGRLFLGFMPRATTRALVDRELAMIAAYVPDARMRSQCDVEDLVRRVRSERIGSTREDLAPGISAVAAPVFDHQGRLVASIMQIGPSSQIHSETAPAGPKLLELANGVSRRFGFDPQGPSFVEAMDAEEGAMRVAPRSQ